MKKRILYISIFILAFNLVGLAQENSKILEGAWVVQKVTVTTGNEEKTYNINETKEYVPALKELLFEGDLLTIKYGDMESAEQAPYTLQENVLTWNHFAAIYLYYIEYNSDGSLNIKYEGTYGSDKKYLYYVTRK